MFFDIELLRFQHKGNFGKAWVAGTKGVKAISKREISEIDIAKLCSHLISYIISESTSPQKRFSLRLSAILMNGTVRIYKEQLCILTAEVLSLLQTVRVPPGSSTIYRRPEPAIRASVDGDIERPQTPIDQVKRKRKPRTELFPTPVSQIPEAETHYEPDFPALPDLQDILNVNMTEARAITLQEEVPGRVFIEEQGDFGAPTDGVTVPTDQLMREWDLDLPQLIHAPAISDSSDPTVALPVIVRAQADVHVEREPADEPPRTPRKRAKVQHRPAAPEGELDLIQPVEETAQVPEVVPPVTTELPAATPPAPRRRSVLRELTDNVERQRRESSKESSTKSGRREDNFEKLFLKPRGFRRRFFPVNRCERDDDIFWDVACPTVSGDLERRDHPEWFDLFTADFRFLNRADSTGTTTSTDSIETRPAEGTSKRGTLERTAGRAVESLSLEDPLLGIGMRLTDQQAVSSGSIAQDGPMEVETVIQIHRESSPREVPLILQAPIHREPSLPELTVVAQELPTTPVRSPRRARSPAPEDRPARPPRRARSPAPGEPPARPTRRARSPEEVPPAVPTPDAEEYSQLQRQRRDPDISSSVKRAAAERERQQKIVDLVLSWIFDERMLTIKDIVGPPYSRLAIARAFQDLLRLAKSQLVTLVNEENSLALKCIEKGPKLLRDRAEMA